MAEPLPPDHPIAQLTDAEKAALPENQSNAGIAIGPMTHLTLSGIGISEDGRMKKTKYLNLLAGTIDDYSDLILTKAEAMRVRNTVFHLKNGSSAAMPIICTGPLCPWATRCPLQQDNKAPIGRQCLIELSLMKQWQLNWFEEYEVDIENFTEITLINEMVEVELQLYRCNLSLSLDPTQSTGVVDVSVGVDHHGNPITQKQISQLIELREKLLTRKHRLIKYLVGDRQEKYKKEAALKTRESRDPSSSMAQLKEQMESLQRQLTAAANALEVIPGEVVAGSDSESEQKGTPREGTALHPDDIIPDDEDE
jgi:hypothetical protein